MFNHKRLLLILCVLAVFSAQSCAQARMALEGVGRRPTPTVTPLAENPSQPEETIPPYLMPLLGPLGQFLHTLNIAAIGGILALYLALLLALLTKRR